MPLQKLTLAAIALFLMVSCSKDDAPAPVVKAEVTIGTQVWATKNLDVATYSDGTVIPQVTDAAVWQNLTTGAWCYYENSTANGTTYGKLYNWYAVAGIHDNDANTPNKKLAPTGWHVPTDAEWATLTDYLGGASIAAGKMKATGTSLWKSPNTDATNSSGLTVLPGGYRLTGNSSEFYGVGEMCLIWSSSEYNTLLANDWVLYSEICALYTGSPSKAAGMSVRCLKD